jgi:NNP family nitrate/nitrite transporter-like MFS transporter
MLNGVLVTFLAENQVFDWGPIEIGWLMGIPVLTGSIFRLPAGILTDKFGGRPVYGILLLICAIPMFLLSYANSFTSFALISFGFGLSGVSFAIGIAFTSVWYPKKWQGTALGIFGAGNAGAALTTLFAPTLLKSLTDNGANIEGWRTLPIIYAVALLVMGVLFLLFAENKKPSVNNKTLADRLSPLKSVRVWRFGLYYFLVFGCFVAFSQWLVPYFVNVYYLPLITAGIFAAMFSLPSGVIRALGGWMSDRWGARKVMYWVLGTSVVVSFMLIVPKMEISSPGKGIMAKSDGVVNSVSDTQIKVVNESRGTNQGYTLISAPNELDNVDDRVLIFPTKEVWQEPVVAVGDEVKKKQLLAKGVTRIYFQANVWIFAILVILIGSIWGIGKAAVYKHIPDYFPDDVGVVGGMVGVLGGLGGFFCPIIFGYLLEGTGLWTSCWMFMLFLSAICLLWMQKVIRNMMRKEVPELSKQIEYESQPSLSEA